MKNWLKTALVQTALLTITATSAIAVGSQIPKLFSHLHGNVRDGDFALHVENQPQGLTLYGTTTCPHCASARRYLRQAGIAFNDQVIDTSVDKQMMFAKLKEQGVPVLVSRTGLISGFNPAAYDELAKASTQR